MSILQKFKDNVLGTTGNLTSHNGRYINFDGTPYGSTKLARVALSPGLSLNLLSAGTLCGVGLTEVSANTAGIVLLALTPPVLAIDSGIRAFANRYVKPEKAQVIDTRGSPCESDVSNINKRYLAVTLGCFMSLPLPVVGMFSNTYGLLGLLTVSKLRAGKWTVMPEPPAPRVWKKKSKKERNRKLQPSFG